MSSAVRTTTSNDLSGSGFVLAVDGTSGSGKSSTSRGVAVRLGLAYLDTGAMFRAITWWLLEQGADVHDADLVTALITGADAPALRSGTDPTAPTITVDGHDVAAAVRSTEVTAAVSPVSTVAPVRARLLDQQRELISAALRGPGIVVEGRDIGSVVWPAAQLKLYLSADASARAIRRTAEEGGADAGATEASLRDRDRIDSSRVSAPLTMAPGAVHLDTTDHTLEAVIDEVVELARTCGAPELPAAPASTPDSAPGGEDR